jgi:hypothetical protein
MVAKGAALGGQRIELRNRLDGGLGKEGKSLETASDSEIQRVAVELAFSRADNETDEGGNTAQPSEDEERIKSNG